MPLKYDKGKFIAYY